MKVCFLVGTLGRGGAEQQLVFMIRALRSNNVDVSVLCLTKGEALEKEIRETGAEIEWIGSSANRLTRLLRVIIALRTGKFDLIQSSHFYTNIYAAIAGRFLGIPNIGAIRSDLFSEIGASRTFGKMQFALPEHLITNSEVALNRALALGINPRNIDLLRNVVELPFPVSIRKKVEAKRLSILFVGRLGTEKRPALFIRLAAQLRLEYPCMDLEFRIVGDGPLRSQLETLRESYGLEPEDVQFLGERSDMAEIYRSSDILVLTSEYEGTPNVILESMAFGIPVVATNVGGVSEILSKKAGILVDPSDFRELVDATINLIDNEELRKIAGQHGQEHVARHHSPTYLEKRLIGIYESLLDRSDR